MSRFAEQLVIGLIGIAITSTLYADDSKSSAEKLQGTWRLVSGEYVDGQQRVAFSAEDIRKRSDGLLTFTVDGRRLTGHAKYPPDFPADEAATALCWGVAEIDFYGAEAPLRFSVVHRSRSGKPMEYAFLYRLIDANEVEIAGNPHKRNIAVASFTESSRTTWRLRRVAKE